ncbi:MAG TPA: enoyl-CoA hydratase-related protein, partial [Burkholderiales bacterium]|nr:enoyl-CoA hydratase-related protein [Burkholderiales bacterium]
MSERLIGRKDGAIGWVIFNNPERRNAVSLDMWQAVPQILGDFEKDPAVRVVVLAGAGDKAFISGADISQFEKQRSGKESVQRYEDISEAALAKLAGFGKPVVAMIRGYCLGAGVNVANVCDLRIAAD